jgi:hypothetical protein
MQLLMNTDLIVQPFYEIHAAVETLVARLDRGEFLKDAAEREPND